MTRRRVSLLAAPPLLLALTLSGCGADEGTEPTDAAAGACLVGATECADIPTGTGGVTSGPDGSVPVADAVAAGIDGPFLVSGLLVVDGAGARLCESLLESYPPQCGGTSLPLQPAEVPEGAVTTSEGDVTWSEQPVLVEGEILDGVFVVRTG